MTFKKIEIAGLHSANPIVEVIDAVNSNLDSLVTAFEDLNNGQGVIGPAGPKGDTGDRGLAGIQGPQGEPGRNGVDGKDGQHGINGKDGVNGKDGEQGPAGKDGKDGINGKDGADGLPGVNGKDGADGLPGRDGVDGKNGIDGKDGLPGKDGAQGIQGVAGAAGKDGAQGLQGVKGDTGATGTQGPAGIGLKGFAAGYVDAGTFVTLDNLKFSVTTGGNRGLSCATVTGTSMLAISASYAMINGGCGANATNWSTMPVYTTTPSGSWFGWSFPNAGDGSTYNIQEVATQRFYRVTLMIGPGYTKNFISIERLY